MNFSEFCDRLQEPLYQVEGSIPRCPPGYVYSRERKECIPKSEKDKISGRLNDKDKNNDNTTGAAYNVWGKTGLNGDGYAYEEAPGRDVNSSHWDNH